MLTSIREVLKFSTVFLEVLAFPLRLIRRFIEDLSHYSLQFDMEQVGEIKNPISVQLEQGRARRSTSFRAA